MRVEGTSPGEGSLIEAEIIARARQGEEAAFEELVRLHQEPAFRLAYLVLGDAEEARDVVQESFVRAFRAIRRFDLSRPWRPWFLRITINQARNRRRSAARHLAALQRLLRLDPDPAPLTSGLAADAPPLPASSLRDLWHAIRSLRREDQQVIYLRFFLELSEVETAGVLGVARGTVKSRLHRTLRRLRQTIERDFPGLRAELQE